MVVVAIGVVKPDKVVLIGWEKISFAIMMQVRERETDPFGIIACVDTYRIGSQYVCPRNGGPIAAVGYRKRINSVSLKST